MKRRGVTRRVVIVFAEYGLRLIAFKPFGESDRAFGVGSVLENSRIINERFRVIGLAADGQAYIRMFRMNVFTAQVNFLGQVM